MTTTNMFLNFGGKWDSPPPPPISTNTHRNSDISLNGYESSMFAVQTVQSCNHCYDRTIQYSLITSIFFPCFKLLLLFVCLVGWLIV